MPADERSLERLLLLDGEAIELSGGYGVSFKAWRVAATADKPHGVKYSLCLFASDDARVVCFDNSHPVRIRSGPGKRKTTMSDHVHEGGKVRPYIFTDAETLLVDFWDAVYRHLKSEDTQ